MIPPSTGTVVPTPASADGWYNTGVSVQLQAAPAAGFSFTNWSGDLTGTANPATITSTGYPKAVTANFGEPTIVRLSLTGGGTGTGQIDANNTFYDLPASVMCAAGSTANLQAEPANGSVFVRWEGDLTGTTNPTSVLMTAAKTVKAVFALDYRQAKVMVDFAAVGLWMKQGGSWLQLSGVDSDKMVGINADGDPEQETLGDFGTLGVWLLDNGFWTQVSGVNPDAMAAVNIDTDPEEEAAVDFAALGLWLWNAGGWTQLSGVNPDGFIGADADGNGADEIIGDFGAIGLWRWDGAAWTAISLNNVETLAAADGDADGAEEVFGDFGAVGLWIWDGAWSQASASNAQGLLAADMDGDGDQEVFADFGSGGLMVWNSGSLEPGLIARPGWDGGGQPRGRRGAGTGHRLRREWIAPLERRERSASDGRQRRGRDRGGHGRRRVRRDRRRFRYAGPLVPAAHEPLGAVERREFPGHRRDLLIRACCRARKPGRGRRLDFGRGVEL